MSEYDKIAEEVNKTPERNQAEESLEHLVNDICEQVAKESNIDIFEKVKNFRDYSIFVAHFCDDLKNAMGICYPELLKIKGNDEGEASAFMFDLTSRAVQLLLKFDYMIVNAGIRERLERDGINPETGVKNEQ